MGKLIKGVNDLVTKRPDLAEEWNYEKNGDLKPEDVTCGSGKKAWWIGKCGHEWKAQISMRNRGDKCPYCSGRKVLPGFNDLESRFSSIAREWNYEKNGDLTPSDVTAKSHKRVWWICELGHEWETAVSTRTSGRNCPYCSGNKILPGLNDLASQNKSLAEEWHPTKNGDLTPEDVFPNTNRKVWWLGKCGHEWEASPNMRTEGSNCPFCSNKRVLQNFNDLASQNEILAQDWHPTKNGDLKPTDVTCGSEKKVWWLGKCGHEWQAIIADRNHGYGCPYCSGNKVLPGFNDLLSRFPSVASEWNYEKNGDLKPENVTGKSTRKVWWLGKCGHEWEAVISNRTENGTGCPYCASKKILPGFNDLASQISSDLFSEWHPTKNGELTPQDVMPYSRKKVWWMCKEGHEWEDSVANHTRGCGCPYCTSSLGEQHVARVLEELNIDYYYNKPLGDCKYKQLLRHDFILLSDQQVIATIEFNGIQHYKPGVFPSNTPEEAKQKFEDIQIRDAIKTTWLKEHGIPQLIIPYWDFDNIEQIIKNFLDSEEVAKSRESLNPIYIK